MLESTDPFCKTDFLHLYNSLSVYAPKGNGGVGHSSAAGSGMAERFVWKTTFIALMISLGCGLCTALEAGAIVNTGMGHVVSGNSVPSGANFSPDSTANSLEISIRAQSTPTSPEETATSTVGPTPTAWATGNLWWSAYVCAHDISAVPTIAVPDAVILAQSAGFDTCTTSSSGCYGMINP